MFTILYLFHTIFLNHQDATEQSCLNLIQLAFPSVVYRKRDGVWILLGISIKDQYKPSYAWDMKAVRYTKEVVVSKPLSYSEPLSPIMDLLKKALQTNSNERVHRVLRAAFPHSTFTWSKSKQRRKHITSVALRKDHDTVPYPHFLKRVHNIIFNISIFLIKHMPIDDYYTLHIVRHVLHSAT